MGFDKRMVGNVGSYGDGRAFEVAGPLVANDIPTIVMFVERYAKKNSITDGEFMIDVIHMFVLQSDRDNIKTYAAAEDMDWEDLKVADGSLELVLRKVFLKYDSVEQVARVQGLTRQDTENSLEFADRYRCAVNDLLPSDRPEPRSCATHIVGNFDEDFTSYLDTTAAHSGVRDVTTIPIVNTEDPASVKRAGRELAKWIVAFHTAFHEHQKVLTHTERVMRRVMGNTMKRDLSVQSRNDNLPKAKKPSYSAPAPPVANTLASHAPRPSTRGITLSNADKEAAKNLNLRMCWFCGSCFADNHSARDCPRKLEPDFRIPTNFVGVTNEFAAAALRLKHLAPVSCKAVCHEMAKAAKENRPAKVNVVEYDGESSDDSDVEMTNNTVNMIHYSSKNVSKGYALTGLAGRRTDMGPPAVPVRKDSKARTFAVFKEDDVDDSPSRGRSFSRGRSRTSRETSCYSDGSYSPDDGSVANEGTRLGPGTNAARLGSAGARDASAGPSRRVSGGTMRHVASSRASSRSRSRSAVIVDGKGKGRARTRSPSPDGGSIEAAGARANVTL
ncbi:hypothetical protein HDZ31DRAFT_77947, partial [Schizophyllum fasciatum]